MKHLLLFALLVTSCTPDCPQPEPVVKEQLAPSEEACIEFAGRGGTTKVECKAEPAPAPAPAPAPSPSPAKAKAKATKPKAK